MSDAFEGWAILELMGHRRMAGLLSTQEIAGQSFLRIDVPTEPAATQFYSASAVYAITPCTEETARAAANLGRVAPVNRWEIPAATSSNVDGAACPTCGLHPADCAFDGDHEVIEQMEPF